MTFIQPAARSGARALTTASESSTKKLIYATPNALLVKLAKLFSLSTLGISSISAPAVMYFWETPAVQATGMNEYLFLGECVIRYIVLHSLSIALAASACSTGALHYLLSPFVGRIYMDTSKPSITPNTTVTLETLDLLARRRETTVSLRDLVPSSRMLLTWTVNPKLMKQQYALERTKGIPVSIHQTRFWLDKRNGVGDAEAVSAMLRTIQENHRRQRVI